MITGPKLRQWLADLVDAVPRVKVRDDEEGVHDLRVALRRIRSLLRIVHSIYGSYHVKLIRTEFKNVADATSSLRDAEVFRETIAGLDVDDDTRGRVEPFLQRYAQKERALRGRVAEMLSKGALDRPVEHLQALLSLPCDPKRDKEAREFARHTVMNAQAEVDHYRSADVEDSVAMHALRICHKRLRYAAEAFSPVLAPELRAWKEVATRFQKVLGDLHDHDVALEIVHQAPLDDATRDATEGALIAKRAKIAHSYLELVGREYRGG